MRKISRKEAIEKLCKHELGLLSQVNRQNLLLDYWTIRDDDADFETLPLALKKDLRTLSEPADVSAKLYDPLISLALRDKWLGVTNHYLSKALSRIGEQAEIVGSVEPLYRCPCCQYHTLAKRKQLDVCRVCLWEDDGTERPDDYSSVNHAKLSEARQTFLGTGACAENLITRIDREAMEKYAK